MWGASTPGLSRTHRGSNARTLQDTPGSDARTLQDTRGCAPECPGESGAPGRFRRLPFTRTVRRGSFACADRTLQDTPGPFRSVLESPRLKTACVPECPGESRACSGVSWRVRDWNFRTPPDTPGNSLEKGSPSECVLAPKGVRPHDFSRPRESARMTFGAQGGASE